MESGTTPREITLDERLRALQSIASVLDWPVRRERDPQACYELTRIVDGLLTCGARGRGAVDLAVGECLDALSVGDRVLDLGYSDVPDYAREEHGIPASTAVKMMRLARALRFRPRLRAAAREGAVSISRAEAVVSVAHGEAEAAWVARARRETVRALREAVDEARRRPPADASAAANGRCERAEIERTCSPGGEDDTARLPGQAVSSSGAQLAQFGNPSAPSAASAGGRNDDDDAWTRLFVDLPLGAQKGIDDGLRWGRRALQRPTAAKWEASRSVREHSGAPLTPGECVVVLFRHLVDVWKPVLTERNTVRHRVLERDGYVRKVPGCSRAAAHAHHILRRSQGGTDDPWNLISLCVAHHLRGVHGGRIRVSGRAPDQLRWELGIQRGVPLAA